MFRCFDPEETFVLRQAQGRLYNPASQIVTETRSNDSYGFTKTAASSTYAVNGLNQYTNVGGATHSFDANGNLTGTGAATYTYDIENRLVKAIAGATTTNLVYDPLGRLFETNQGTGATTTRFLNDGDAMVVEYNSQNDITNRFVHGSNAAADDPLVWYSGSGTGNKRWLHADHLGSIVAWTNSTGGLPTINKYDEYGLPAVTNTGRFQYTGQAWIGELSLYYYKARFYAPGLGRFLQTDPVGYKDQMNLSAYVFDDPINKTDPTGLRCTVSPDGRTAVCKIDNPSAKLLADQKAGGHKLRDLNQKYTNTVNRLLSDRSKEVTLAKVGELGSRITRDYKTTQGEIADQLISAEVSVSDTSYVDPKTGVPDRFWKADAYQTPTGPRIGLYPRAFDRGMTIEKTFIHEGAHLTVDGQNLLRDFTGSHQEIFDRMEDEVWQP